MDSRTPTPAVGEGIEGGVRPCWCARSIRWSMRAPMALDRLVDQLPLAFGEVVIRRSEWDAGLAGEVAQARRLRSAGADQEGGAVDHARACVQRHTPILLQPYDDRHSVPDMTYDSRHSEPSLGLLEHAPRPGMVRADDGRDLSITVFEPIRPVRGVALVASAMATPASFYAAFARRLSEHGIRTVTFDYRTAVGTPEEMRREDCRRRSVECRRGRRPRRRRRRRRP